MRQTKILPVFLLAALIISCGSNNASDPISAELETLERASVGPGQADGRLGPGMGGLYAVLELSDAQKEQIAEIVKAHRESMREQFRERDSRPSREERERLFDEKRKELQAQIFTVLTPEQQNKYNELEAALERGEVPQELIDKRIELMTEHLQLTESQVEQLRQLDSWATVIRAPGPKMGSREDRNAQRDAMKAHRESVRAILTAEQLAKMPERREHGRRHWKEAGGPGSGIRLERLSRELSLTQAQQAQLNELFANLRKEMRESSAERGPEFRSQMHERMQQLDTEIKSILTEDQIRKYEAFKSERHRRFGGPRED